MLNGVKGIALVTTAFVAIIGFTLYPIFIYPMRNIDKYKEAQKKNRDGINQEDIQPGDMRVWRDPFGRK